MESSLTAEERTERARLAAEARWGKRFDWETSTITDCESKLAYLRTEMERGGLILQKRMSTERVNSAICYNPGCKNGPRDTDGNPTPAKIDIGSGRFAGSRSRHNPDSGVMETAYACSAACFLYMSANFKHITLQQPERQQMPDNVLNESIKPLI